MNLLITLLVYAVILGLIYWLIMRLPLPAPFGLIVQIVFVILVIVILYNFVAGGSLGLPALR